MRQAVITGAGAVTPLGASLAATRAALLAGRSALAPCRAFDAAGFAVADAGEIGDDFDPRVHFRAPKALKLADRPTRLAVAAAAMALADGGWPEGAGDSLGVALGISSFDLHADKIAAALWPDEAGRAAADIPFMADRVLSGLTPLWLLTMLPNMTSAHVAIQFGATGPNTTVMSDAAAGLQAIGEAAAWVRAGECAAVLAGGTDSMLTPTFFAAREQHGAFGTTPPPASEAAAVLLVEDAAQAAARAAVALAAIAGYGSATGACAESRAIGAALAESGWTPDAVDCVCARDAEAVRGFRDGVRRVSMGGAMGDAVAANAPVALAAALGGAWGRRVLCVVPADVGPAAALAIETRGAAR